MKRGSEHDARLVRTFAVVALLIAAVVAGWALSVSMLSSRELLIKQIDIEGLDHLRREEVLALAGLDRPRSTFNVVRTETAERLLTSAWIRSVEIKRPGREILRIELQEAIPRLIVAAPELVLVDEEGRAIDQISARYEGLPLLTGASRKIPSSEDREQVDPETLALSLGLGGPFAEAFDMEVVDGGVVRDAVKLVDTWATLHSSAAWPIRELGWHAAEGFTMVVGGQVEILLGHRDYAERLARADAAFKSAHAQLARLERMDVRPKARAILRFSDSALDATGGQP